MIQSARNVSVWGHSLRAPAMVGASAEGYIQPMNNATIASSASSLPSRRLGGAGIATVLTGLALCFIGARFLVVPGAAAAGFGVPLTGLAAYAVAKGVRDLSFGGLLVAFPLLGERRAAALTLLLGAVIPVVDGAIVLAWRGAHPGYLAVHWGTAVLCVALGALQLRRRA
ncbi:DUF4267 domain-containing protein [Sorangium sp. So ce1151]|uniref:DUF4267 domain-containing protein n=1 Tax=Sorangium sp. So ce1151 TaxID=3133332 RepID=UPI003F5FDC33